MTKTPYNITLTSANTEYSQALPDGTRSLKFNCRTANAVRYAFESGKVAAPTAPYLTLKRNGKYRSDKNDLTSKTVYFAAGVAGLIVEMEAVS